MAHLYRLGLVTWGYQVRIPVGTYIFHRGCAYTVLQTVQRHGVYSAAYGTVHYKEHLKSFEIRVGHSPGFGLPSVAILPWLCRKRHKHGKSIFIYSAMFIRSLQFFFSEHPLMDFPGWERKSTICIFKMASMALMLYSSIVTALTINF